MGLPPKNNILGTIIACQRVCVNENIPAGMVIGLFTKTLPDVYTFATRVLTMYSAYHASPKEK
jgi:hypothetical protein